MCIRDRCWVCLGFFENSEEMALNLGFSGFRRGSYDYYKTDWKYLNDASTRGAIDGISSIEGVLIPAERQQCMIKY